jgi:hypothetical protein
MFRQSLLAGLSCVLLSTQIAGAQDSGHGGDFTRVSFKPVPYSTLPDSTSDTDISVGDMFQYQGIITVCLRQNDFEDIIAAEKSGVDGTKVFNSKPDCDTLKLPPLKLTRILTEFTTTKGMDMWLIEAQSPITLKFFYIGIPAQWLKKP